MVMSNRFACALLILAAVLVAGCGGSGDGDSGNPSVVTTSPSNSATGVGTNAIVAATFDEPMDETTITTASFTLEQGGTPVAGTVQSSGRTAIFTPSADLNPSTTYTATITTAAQDEEGNPLEIASVWSFTTGSGEVNAEAVTLGTTLDDFAVLASTAVNNTLVSDASTTIVTGDLGVSPGTTVTGFAAGQGTLVGTQHANDAAAILAQTELTTAINDINGLDEGDGAVTVSGSIGGLTLGPGLYITTTSIGVLDEDLTLDAGGDPTAVFIFRAGTTLSIAAGRQVILANGATASNVFWKAGTSVSLETGSKLVGTVMATRGINIASSATLVNGRALSDTGSVTLEEATVTKP